MKRKNKVAVLGPEGTFTEIAAKKIFGEADVIYRETVKDAFESLGEADYAVAAAENSLEGAVNATMDCLIEYPVKIRAETVLDIRLCLLGLEGARREDIKTVVSHPHALAQCQKFLSENLRGARIQRHESTAAALRETKEKGARDTAALGPEESARIYGLSIIQRDVQDSPSQTRFLAVSKEEGEGDKTSIVFVLGDRPGALYETLRDFAQGGINLTRIESRPSKRKLGEYVFFVDFEGALKDEKIRRILDGLKEKTLFLKILGSYSRIE